MAARQEAVNFETLERNMVASDPFLADVVRTARFSEPIEHEVYEWLGRVLARKYSVSRVEAAVIITDAVQQAGSR